MVTEAIWERIAGFSGVDEDKPVAGHMWDLERKLLREREATLPQRARCEVPSEQVYSLLIVSSRRSEGFEHEISMEHISAKRCPGALPRQFPHDWCCGNAFSGPCIR